MKIVGAQYTLCERRRKAMPLRVANFRAGAGGTGKRGEACPGFRVFIPLLNSSSDEITRRRKPFSLLVFGHFFSLELLSSLVCLIICHGLGCGSSTQKSTACVVHRQSSACTVHSCDRMRVRAHTAPEGANSANRRDQLRIGNLCAHSSVTSLFLLRFSGECTLHVDSRFVNKKVEDSNYRTCDRAQSRTHIYHSVLRASVRVSDAIRMRCHVSVSVFYANRFFIGLKFHFLRLFSVILAAVGINTRSKLYVVIYCRRHWKREDGNSFTFTKLVVLIGGR